MDSKDGTLRDSNGSQIRLVGVNAIGLEFGSGSSSKDSCGLAWPTAFPASEFDNVAAWGFNSVRIPISWENLEPTAPSMQNGTWTHSWDSRYLATLDAIISQFGQRHIAVILDFSQVALSSAFHKAPGGFWNTGGFCEGWGNPIWLYPGITSPTSGEQLGTAICNFFNDQPMVGNSVPHPICIPSMG